MEWRAKVEEELAKKAAKYSKSMTQVFIPNQVATKGVKANSCDLNITTKRSLPLYKVMLITKQPNKDNQTVLYTLEEADLIWVKIKQYFEDQGFPINDCKSKFKFTAKCNFQDEMIFVNTELNMVDENVICIKVSRAGGTIITFLTIFKVLKNHLTEATMLL